MKIGFALCGSFCTYAQVFPVMELLTRDYDIVPILSQNAGTINSRFGAAQEHIANIQEICGISPILSIAEAEPGTWDCGYFCNHGSKKPFAKRTAGNRGSFHE